MNFRDYKRKLRKRASDEDWETEEFMQWVVNDESMLSDIEDIVGREGWRAADTLKEWAAGLDIPGVDLDQVDWQSVIEDTEDTLHEGVEWEAQQALKPPPPPPEQQWAHLPPDQNPYQWQAGDVLEDRSGSRSHVQGPIAENGYLPMKHVAPDQHYHGEDLSLHPSALVNTYAYKRVGNQPLDYNWLADPSLDQPGNTYLPEGWTSRMRGAMMPQDPFHAPGRTCPNCGGGIARVEGQTPPNFCTKCGHRYFDDQVDTLGDIQSLPEIDHPGGLE